MNAKKCKALRSALKQSGVNWRDTQYDEDRVKLYTRQTQLIRRRLKPSCGRAKYQQAKENLHG